MVDALNAREKYCSTLASCGRCEETCLNTMKCSGNRSRISHASRHAAFQKLPATSIHCFPSCSIGFLRSGRACSVIVGCFLLEVLRLPIWSVMRCTVLAVAAGGEPTADSE